MYKKMLAAVLLILSFAQTALAQKSLTLLVKIAEDMPEMKFSIVKTGDLMEHGQWAAHEYAATLTNAESGEALQSIAFASVADIEPKLPEWLVKFVDLNFDGVLDLDIPFYGLDPYLPHNFFLWDAQVGQYISVPEAEMPLLDYRLYPESGIISNFIYHTAFTVESEIYQWVDGKLTLLRRMEEMHPAEKGGHFGVILWGYEDGKSILFEDQEIPFDVFQEEYAKRYALLWEGIDPGEPCYAQEIPIVLD